MLDPELAREERKLCGDFCGFELKDLNEASGTPFCVVG